MSGETHSKSPRSDGEYLSTLARGLSVLRAFTRERPVMTLTEVAQATELNPAVARRCLNTLEHLRYVRREGKRFMLTPEVIAFATAFLDASHVEEVVRPILQEVRDRTGDSSSLAVMSGADVLYLVHVSTNRMVRLAAGVGTRFPAYATSMGRVMLAHQSDAAVEDYLNAVALEALTSKTETSASRLREALRAIRAQGFATIQDELDYGIVSIAVPVRNQAGEVVAAINCSTATTRINQRDIVASRLPHLQEAARRIEAELQRFPVLEHALGSAR